MAKKPRLPKQALAALRTLRARANFETARFGGIDQPLVTLRGRSRTVDEFVKAETEIYRSTWVAPHFDALIAWAEGEDVDLCWLS